jgi:HlyD family secretion protein
MKLGRACLVAAATCILCLLSGCGRNGPDPTTVAPAPTPTVQVVTVRRGTLEQVLPATGTLETLPNMEASLAPQVSGTLLALQIRFGQTVQRGQIIAQISSRQLDGQIQQATATYGQSLVQVEQAEANSIQQSAQTRTAILQAQASLRNAQAALEAANAVLTGDVAAAGNAQQNLQREQTLYKDGLVAQRDLENAELNVQTNAAQVDAQKQTVEAQRETVAGQQAAVDAARAGDLGDLVKRKDILVARQQVSNALGALDTARGQLSLYTIRAPLSGEITAVGAGVGESVDSSTKLVTVSNLDRLQLDIAAPGALARIVRAGDDVLFTADSLPGRRFQTTVETVSPQVDSASGSVQVLASVPNPSHALKDDVTVAVEIVTARHVSVNIVPQSAVLSDPDTGDKSVMTIGADGVARIVPVTTGIEDGTDVEILSGVSPGMIVASSGQYGIPDGTHVSAIGSSSKPSGDAANGS